MNRICSTIYVAIRRTLKNSHWSNKLCVNIQTVSIDNMKYVLEFPHA